MRIAISGSSGLIGSALTARLETSGHQVISIVRRPPESTGEIAWDPSTGEIDATGLDGVDAVVNLNGRSIGEERWDAEEKQLLWDSRIAPTSLLARTVAQMDSPPAAFLSASAIGIYGDRGDETLTEESPPGTGFLAELAVAWEAAAQPAADAGIRTVFLRTGIVLSADGGALGKLMNPFGWGFNPYKLGLGGKLGKGDQWWSWIAMADQVASIAYLLDSSIEGPVNLTAPNPVRNSEFIDALGDVIRRPTMLPTPRFALDVILGRELAQALLFDSARVIPAKLVADGYPFEFQRLAVALENELA